MKLNHNFKLITYNVSCATHNTNYRMEYCHFTSYCDDTSVNVMYFTMQIGRDGV